MQFSNMRLSLRNDMIEFWQRIGQKKVQIAAGGAANMTIDEHADTMSRLIESLDKAQTVIFPKEQAEVFLALGDTYSDSLDYRLPFDVVHMQFASPVSMLFEDDLHLGLESMILTQANMSASSLKSSKLTFFARADGEDRAIDLTETNEDLYVNTVFFVARKVANGSPVVFKTYWFSGAYQSILEDGPTNSLFKPLAIACVGYINCENIYLHKEGEVSDKINRKREREGKKILEPYYVCRIRGVEYDSNGEPTGEGAHHGFRYDVRGHFRKLVTGKTTWVRPHQRGLQHELYIPKTYVVEVQP